MDKIAQELNKLAKNLTAYSIQELKPYASIDPDKITFYAATSVVTKLDDTKRRLSQCATVCRDAMNGTLKTKRAIDELGELELGRWIGGMETYLAKEGLIIVYYQTGISNDVTEDLFDMIDEIVSKNATIKSMPRA